MPEELLTVEEVAKWLKVNPQTVRNWIDRGDLRALRIGTRRVRVRQSDLDRFIAAGEEEAAAALEDHEAAGQLATALLKALAAIETRDATELASALRALAATAGGLADALEKARPGFVDSSADEE